MSYTDQADAPLSRERVEEWTFTEPGAAQHDERGLQSPTVDLRPFSGIGTEALLLVSALGLVDGDGAPSCRYCAG